MNDKIATPLQSQDWFQQMIENLQNLLTEGEFTARYTLIQVYHTTGAMIAEHEDKAENLIEETARALNRSTRLIYQCRQFYEKFPKLDKLPDGKAISWRQIANELLPAHGKKKPASKDELIAQFIADIFPNERKERKKFIKEIVEEWEAYEP